LPGWPCDTPLDELRAAWVRETVPVKRKELLDRFQERAFEAVPYAYFGQFSPAYAARKSLKHLDQYWNIPTLWVLDK
jgi:peptide/nickel transport system substrate-binding protein